MGNRNAIGKKGNGKLGNLPVVAKLFSGMSMVGLLCNYSVFCVSICTPSGELKIWNTRKRIVYVLTSDIKVVANEKLKQNVLQFEAIAVNIINGTSSNQPDAVAYSCLLYTSDAADE